MPQCEEYIFVSKFTHKSFKANDSAREEFQKSQNLGINAFFDKFAIFEKKS